MSQNNATLQKFFFKNIILICKKTIKQWIKRRSNTVYAIKQLIKYNHDVQNNTKYIFLLSRLEFIEDAIEECERRR